MARLDADQSHVDVVPLDASAVGDVLQAFSCGDDDLDDFLRSDALALQRDNIVRTYLARYQGRLEGYVALLSDAVVLETRERKRLALGPGAHPIVPALKVARLAARCPFEEPIVGSAK